MQNTSTQSYGENLKNKIVQTWERQVKLYFAKQVGGGLKDYKPSR